MDYLDINAEEETFSVEIIENVLNDINSKKILIREFKEKYNINYLVYKEKKENIIIKRADINKILDTFKQIISISIKAIAFLLIKLKNNNKNSTGINSINRYSIRNIKSQASIYNTQQFHKLFNNQLNKKEKTLNFKNHKNQINLMKNNRSYNHLFNKDTNKNYFKISTDDRKNDKNDYRNDIIIDNNIYTYNKVKPNNKRRHRKITLDTNYYNYLKNILGNHSSNNDKSNIIGYENNHLVSSYNNTKYKFNIILDNDNKQRSQYIKINNVKLRIKSPIRQTLKEMIIKLFIIHY